MHSQPLPVSRSVHSESIFASAEEGGGTGGDDGRRGLRRERLREARAREGGFGFDVK